MEKTDVLITINLKIQLLHFVYVIQNEFGMKYEICDK